MWAKFIAKYQTLPSRDQRAAIAIGVVVALALLYSQVLQPSFQYYGSQKRHYEEQLALNAWLAENTQKLEQASSSTKTENNTAGKSVTLTLISESAKQAGIELNRIEPHAQRVVVAIDKVPFTDLLNWLQQLSLKHGVHISEASINRTGENLASARLSLSGS